MCNRWFHSSLRMAARNEIIMYYQLPGLLIIQPNPLVASAMLFIAKTVIGQQKQ
jgi:hypothetical protein